MNRCKICNKELSEDEVAVTKKMINRGAVEYLCIACLASHFQVEKEDIVKRIEYYKEEGCTLFACNRKVR